MTAPTAPPLAGLAGAPRRGAGAARGDRPRADRWRCPTRPGRCSWPRWRASRTRRPLLLAVPTGAEAERLARDLGAVPRARARSSCSRRGRRCRSSGCRRRSRRWAGASACCGGSASGRAPPDGRRGAGAGAGAAARPARRGGRAGRRPAGRPGRPRRAGGAAGRRRVPARVPGGGARRGRGAGLDRRRLPVDRRPPRAHRPLGRRGRPPLRRSRSPTSARPTTSTRRAIFPTRELLPTDEVRERAAELLRAQPWGREQWERLAEGQVFDGMESWLPWLAEREHLLPDLLPDTALALLVEPKRMRDRAQELLDEEASLAATLAGHLGRVRRATTCPRLSLDVRPPARAHECRRGVGAVDARGPRHAARRRHRVRPGGRRRRRAGASPALARGRGLPRRARGRGHRLGAAPARRARGRRASTRDGEPHRRVRLVVAPLERGVVLPARAARARRRGRPHRPPARAPARARRASRASTTTTRSNRATTSCTTCTASAATSR